MALAAIGVLGFLIMLALVLFAAMRLRPRIFKLRATATKWLVIDLEMQSDPGIGQRDENRRELDHGSDQV